MRVAVASLLLVAGLTIGAVVLGQQLADALNRLLGGLL